MWRSSKCVDIIRNQVFTGGERCKDEIEEPHRDEMG